ncbi:MAG: class I SAM-dependent methyltransferase, partial [Bacteroidia bacterium]|nr:class I SAM-dependent methyltransferase [Bacteroidia bacterium]
MYLLFPGRHLLNTQFQEQYLRSVLKMPFEKLHFWKKSPSFTGELTEIIFAVTSCNQENSRYNPIPFSIRSVGLDRFGADLKLTLGISYRILGIPHFPPSPQFADYVLKEIEEQTEGHLQLTPQNTIVLCSTPTVSELFDQLGFSILPCELGTDAITPTQLLRLWVEAGESWHQNTTIRKLMSPATFSLWNDFEDIPRRILRLWRDPLLTDDGGLTETRDYSTYSYAMSNPIILELKYQDIKDCIVEGKIVDEGCADGALLIPIARDFRDSDCIGIDITSEFIARCKERQRM